PRGTTATVGSVTAVRMSVHRHQGRVDAWAVRDALAELRRASVGDPAGADVSVWLDSSDESGISVFADATGPLAYTVEHRVGRGSTLSTGEELTGSLFDSVDVLLSRRPLVDSGAALPFDFRPGFLGYIGYEVKAETGGQAAHLAPRPDAWLLFADRAVVIDHRNNTAYALALHTEAERLQQEAWLHEMATLVIPSAQEREEPRERPALAASDLAVAQAGRHSPETYRHLVRRAQRAIRSGETYEVCLTNEVTWPDRVDAASTYRAMRDISPVPHAAWLECGGFSVLSASPERFVALSAQGQVRAEPIKGTRARDPDVERDRAVALELAGDAKERAENLMIVDLLRNDLHRVCRAGSVEVPEMFAVRTWSTVHQLVSTITGQLAPGLRAADVLRSCFPGGSMTGAPKVRTMEILDALEGGARGIYSGAIGWLGVNGAMDTSIVIRSVVLGPVDSEGRSEAVFGVGGAITALSDPDQEYMETLVKARGVAAALGSRLASPTRCVSRPGPAPPHTPRGSARSSK
ncbi:MAG: aminodeoxychorismate synthase component I, partial [Ornithinimicrobium sp.]